MTLNQLENIQVAARAMAQEIALDFLVPRLCNQHSQREILQRCAIELDNMCIERTIPGLDPNVSMLLDGETQQALRDLERRLLLALNG